MARNFQEIEEHNAQILKVEEEQKKAKEVGSKMGDFNW